MYSLWYAALLARNTNVNIGDLSFLRKPADKVSGTASSISTPLKAAQPPPSAPVRTPSTPKDIPGRSPPVQAPVPPPAKKAPPPIQPSNRFLPGHGQSISPSLKGCINSAVRKNIVEQEAAIEAFVRTAGPLESENEKQELEQRVRADLANKNRELSAELDRCLLEAAKEAEEIAVQHVRASFQKEFKKFNNEMTAASARKAGEKAAAEEASALQSRIKEVAEKTAMDEFMALEKCTKLSGTLLVTDYQTLGKCLQDVASRKAAADVSAMSNLLEDAKKKIAAEEEKAKNATLQDLLEKEKVEAAAVEQCFKETTGKKIAEEIIVIQQLYKIKTEETLAVAEAEVDRCIKNFSIVDSSEEERKVMREKLEACIKQAAKKKADTDAATMEALIIEAAKKIQSEEITTIYLCTQRSLKKLKEGSGGPYDRFDSKGIGTAPKIDEQQMAEPETGDIHAKDQSETSPEESVTGKERKSAPESPESKIESPDGEDGSESRSKIDAVKDASTSKSQLSPGDEASINPIKTESDLQRSATHSDESPEILQSLVASLQKKESEASSSVKSSVKETASQTVESSKILPATAATIERPSDDKPQMSDKEASESAVSLRTGQKKHGGMCVIENAQSAASEPAPASDTAPKICSQAHGSDALVIGKYGECALPPDDFTKAKTPPECINTVWRVSEACTPGKKSVKETVIQSEECSKMLPATVPTSCVERRPDGKPPLSYKEEYERAGGGSSRTGQWKNGKCECDTSETQGRKNDYESARSPVSFKKEDRIKRTQTGTFARKTNENASREHNDCLQPNSRGSVASKPSRASPSTPRNYGRSPDSGLYAGRNDIRESTRARLSPGSLNTVKKRSESSSSGKRSVKDTARQSEERSEIFSAAVSKSGVGRQSDAKARISNKKQCESDGSSQTGQARNGEYVGEPSKQNEPAQPPARVAFVSCAPAQASVSVPKHYDQVHSGSLVRGRDDGCKPPPRDFSSAKLSAPSNIHAVDNKSDGSSSGTVENESKGSSSSTGSAKDTTSQSEERSEKLPATVASSDVERRSEAKARMSHNKQNQTDGSSRTGQWRNGECINDTSQTLAKQNDCEPSRSPAPSKKEDGIERPQTDTSPKKDSVIYAPRDQCESDQPRARKPIACKPAQASDTVPKKYDQARGSGSLVPGRYDGCEPPPQDSISAKLPLPSNIAVRKESEVGSSGKGSIKDTAGLTEECREKLPLTGASSDVEIRSDAKARMSHNKESESDGLSRTSHLKNESECEPSETLSRKNDYESVRSPVPFMKENGIELPDTEMSAKKNNVSVASREYKECAQSPALASVVTKPARASYTTSRNYDRAHGSGSVVPDKDDIHEPPPQDSSRAKVSPHRNVRSVKKESVAASSGKRSIDAYSTASNCIQASCDKNLENVIIREMCNEEVQTSEVISAIISHEEAKGSKRTVEVQRSADTKREVCPLPDQYTAENTGGQQGVMCVQSDQQHATFPPNGYGGRRLYKVENTDPILQYLPTGNVATTSCADLKPSQPTPLLEETKESEMPPEKVAMLEAIARAAKLRKLQKNSRSPAEREKLEKEAAELEMLMADLAAANEPQDSTRKPEAVILNEIDKARELRATSKVACSLSVKARFAKEAADIERSIAESVAICQARTEAARLRQVASIAATREEKECLEREASQRESLVSKLENSISARKESEARKLMNEVVALREGARVTSSDAERARFEREAAEREKLILENTAVRKAVFEAARLREAAKWAHCPEERCCLEKAAEERETFVNTFCGSSGPPSKTPSSRDICERPSGLARQGSRRPSSRKDSYGLKRSMKPSSASSVAVSIGKEHLPKRMDQKCTSYEALVGQLTSEENVRRKRSADLPKRISRVGSSVSDTCQLADQSHYIPHTETSKRPQSQSISMKRNVSQNGRWEEWRSAKEMSPAVTKKQRRILAEWLKQDCGKSTMKSVEKDDLKLKDVCQRVIETGTKESEESNDRLASFSSARSFLSRISDTTSETDYPDTKLEPEKETKSVHPTKTESVRQNIAFISRNVSSQKSSETKAPDRSSKQASDRSSTQASNRICLKTSDRTSTQASNRASMQASERASTQVSDRASTQVSDRASTQASNRASMQASERASTQVSDRASTQVSDRASTQVSDRASTQVSDGICLKTSDRASMQASERASTQVSDRASMQTSERASTQVSDRVCLKTSDRASIQASDRSSAQASDHSSTQASNRICLKFSDRTSTQASNRASMQASKGASTPALERASTQVSDRTSIQVCVCLKTSDRSSVQRTPLVSGGNIVSSSDEKSNDTRRDKRKNASEVGDASHPGASRNVDQKSVETKTKCFRLTGSNDKNEEKQKPSDNSSDLRSTTADFQTTQSIVQEYHRQKYPDNYRAAAVGKNKALDRQHSRPLQHSESDMLDEPVHGPCSGKSDTTAVSEELESETITAPDNWPKTEEKSKCIPIKPVEVEGSVESLSAQIPVEITVSKNVPTDPTSCKQSSKETREQNLEGKKEVESTTGSPTIRPTTESEKKASSQVKGTSTKRSLSLRQSTSATSFNLEECPTEIPQTSKSEHDLFVEEVIVAVELTARHAAGAAAARDQAFEAAGFAVKAVAFDDLKGARRAVEAAHTAAETAAKEAYCAARESAKAASLATSTFSKCNRRAAALATASALAAQQDSVTAGRFFNNAADALRCLEVTDLTSSDERLAAVNFKRVITSSICSADAAEKAKAHMAAAARAAEAVERVVADASLRSDVDVSLHEQVACVAAKDAADAAQQARHEAQRAVRACVEASKIASHSERSSFITSAARHSCSSADDAKVQAAAASKAALAASSYAQQAHNAAAVISSSRVSESARTAACVAAEVAAAKTAAARSASECSEARTVASQAATRISMYLPNDWLCISHDDFKKLQDFVLGQTAQAEAAARTAAEKAENTASLATKAQTVSIEVQELAGQDEAAAFACRYASTAAKEAVRLADVAAEDAQAASNEVVVCHNAAVNFSHCPQPARSESLLQTKSPSTSTSTERRSTTRHSHSCTRRPIRLAQVHET